MNISVQTRRRIIFLLIFVGLYCIVTMVAFLMAISTGIGIPDAGDPPPTPMQQSIDNIGEIITNILLGPIMAIHDIFFMGRSLPFGDWAWIIGLGFLYGLLALVAWEKLMKRAR